MEFFLGSSILSILILFIINYAMTRYNRDCRAFVFEVRDDVFIDAVNPLLFFTLIASVITDFLGIAGLGAFRQFLMGISCGAIACRFLLGKVTRQWRNDYVNMNRKYQEMVEFGENEYRSIIANGKAAAKNLRKEMAEITQKKPSLSDDYFKKHVPIYGTIGPEDCARFILISSDWWGTFKDVINYLPKDCLVRTQYNGPTIFLIDPSTNTFVNYYYKCWDKNESTPSTTRGSDLQVFGFRWGPKGWEEETISVFHYCDANRIQVSQSLFAMFLELGATIVDADSIEELSEAYLAHAITPSPAKTESLGVEMTDTVRSVVNNGTDERCSQYASAGHVMIYIEEAPPLNRVIIGPNGWWEEFKTRMQKGIYRNHAFYNVKDSLVIFPVMGVHFPHAEYMFEDHLNADDDSYSRLKIFGYQWNPDLEYWENREIRIFCHPGEAEEDMHAALCNMLASEAAKRQNAITREADLFRVFQKMGETSQTDTPSFATIAGATKPVFDSSQITIPNDARPFLDRGDVQVFIAGKPGAFVPMRNAVLHQIIEPVIDICLREINVNFPMIGKYFEDIRFIEVDNDHHAILDFSYGMPDGGVDHIFAYPANATKIVGPITTLTEFDPVQNSTSHKYFAVRKTLTAISTNGSMVTSDTVQRYIDDQILKLNIDPFIKFLNFAFDFIPLLAPNTAAPSLYRASLITEECFNQLKANTSILKEHYFVDERGKSYFFQDGDGHEGFYDELRNRVWCVIPGGLSLDFEISADSIRWLYKREGSPRHNTMMRLTSFKCYRLSYEMQWLECWEPFIYNPSEMDEFAVRSAIVSRFQERVGWPMCFRTLSEVLHCLLPREYHKFHSKVDE